MATAANAAVSFPDGVHTVHMRSKRHRRVSPPLHLAVVFGLDEKTAIRYAEAARQLLETTAEQHHTGHHGQIRPVATPEA